MGVWWNYWIIEEGCFASPVGHCSESWILQMQARDQRGFAETSQSQSLCPTRWYWGFPKQLPVRSSYVWNPWQWLPRETPDWSQFDAFFGMERGLGTESKFLIFSEIKQQYKGVETWREKFLLPGWAGANPKSLSGRWRPAIPVQTAVFYQWSTPRFKITGKDCFGRMVIVKECVPQPVWRRAAGRACHIYHRVVECLGISIPVKTRRSRPNWGPWAPDESNASC